MSKFKYVFNLRHINLCIGYVSSSLNTQQTAKHYATTEFRRYSWETPRIETEDTVYTTTIKWKDRRRNFMKAECMVPGAD